MGQRNTCDLMCFFLLVRAQLADIQPPLDYAPKSSPNETGMLNEEFGLERVKPATEATEEPARV